MMRRGFALQALIVLIAFIIVASIVSFLVLKISSQASSKTQESQQLLTKLYERLKSANLKVLVVYESDVPSTVINNLEAFFKKSYIPADFKTPSFVTSSDYYSYNALIILASNKLMSDNLFLYDLLSKAQTTKLNIILLDFAHKYETSTLYPQKTFYMAGGRLKVSKEFSLMEEFRKVISTSWPLLRVQSVPGVVLMKIEPSFSKMELQVRKKADVSCPLYEVAVPTEEDVVLYIYDQANNVLYKYNGTYTTVTATVSIDNTKQTMTIDAGNYRVSDVPYVLLSDSCSTAALLEASNEYFRIPIVYIDGTYYILNYGEEITLTSSSPVDYEYFSFVIQESTPPEGTLTIYLNKKVIPAVVLTNVYSARVVYMPGEPFLKEHNDAWSAILGGVLLYLSEKP